MLVSKAALILVGAVFIWLSVLSKFSPFLALALTLSAEYCAWRSDKAKALGETLLRKLDYRDSFGWEISKSELSDVLARTSKKLRRQIPPEDSREGYFASRDPVGATRALRNIQESSWWSKHLAEKMGRYTLGATTVATIGSILLLIITVGTVQNFQVLAGIGRVVTAGLMLAGSLGLVRLTAAYYYFNRKAQRAEERAEELLKYDCGEIEAIKLYHEYHLDRAIAPLVPDHVWKWNRDQLNELWNDYRAN